MSQVVNIKLSRFEQAPWGFRMHGGADFGTPLLIQKVNTESLSEAAGLQPGDVLLKVNGEEVECLKHKEVQDKIIRAGNSFQLTVARGGVLSEALKPITTPAPAFNQSSLPRPNPEGREWGGTLEKDRAGAADSAEEFTRQFMAQLKGDVAPVVPPPQHCPPQLQPVNGSRPQSASYNGVPHSSNPSLHQPAQKSSFTPAQNSSFTPAQNGSFTSVPTRSRTQTPVNMQHGQQGNLANRQYNTPQALYSEDNIQEVLSQQAEVLANGVKGINFNQYKIVDPQGVAHESEVLKYLRETESGQTKSFGSAHASRTASRPQSRNNMSLRMGRRGWRRPPGASTARLSGWSRSSTSGAQNRNQV